MKQKRTAWVVVIGVTVILGSCGIPPIVTGGYATWSDRPPLVRRVLLPEGHAFYLDSQAPLQDQEKGRSAGFSGAFDNGTRADLLPRLILGMKLGEIMTQDRLTLLEQFGLKPTLGTLANDSTIKIFEAGSALDLLEHLPRFSKETWIDFVHPDFRLKFRDSLTSWLPNEQSKNQTHYENLSGDQDPLTAKAWHLPAINAPIFWTQTMGSPLVTVAVIDLGFEGAHPDLKDGWLQNHLEIPENGLDDDGNGYRDDVIGWNFVTNSPNLIYGSGPGHGTATSGIIGARQNGQGTMGVCPRCLLLPLVIDDQVSTAIMAFQYAKRQGAAVISNSWGYALDLPVMQGLVAAIKENITFGREGKGSSVVFAMGNTHSNDCEGPSPDISAVDGVIAVSAVNQGLEKLHSSGYGPCLDLVAPSSATPKGGIVTTDRVGKKGFNTGQPDDLEDLSYTQRFYGTSAAAPQVAGALGLLYSRWPGISRQKAEEILFNAAKKIHQDNGGYDPITRRSLIYGYGLLYCCSDQRYDLTVAK